MFAPVYFPESEGEASVVIPDTPVCGSFSVTPRVSGTLSVAPRVTGTFAHEDC
jgi:hypothetical protein